MFRLVPLARKLLIEWLRKCCLRKFKFLLCFCETFYISPSQPLIARIPGKGTTCLADFFIVYNHFLKELKARSGHDLEAKQYSDLLHCPHKFYKTRVGGKNLDQTRQGTLLLIFSARQKLHGMQVYLENIQKCLTVGVVNCCWRREVLEITPMRKVIHA